MYCLAIYLIYIYIYIYFLTKIQTKNAISNEFWNKMNWSKSRTMSGLLNQKCLSEGFTRGTSWSSAFFSTTLCASLLSLVISVTCCASWLFILLSTASWAKLVIMCSNLAPTKSSSCHSNQLKNKSNYVIP